MNDLISRTRPTDAALRSEWSPDAAFDATKLSQNRGVRRGLPRRILLVAGAAAAAGVLAVPVGLPGWVFPSAAAAPLRLAAAGAATQAPPMWATGQFLHVQTTSIQDDEQGKNRIVRDDWFAPDGWVWSKRVGTRMDGRPLKEEYIFPPLDGWMRPGYAATMPTEPHALDLFLRARATGSSSQDEAVFVAIGDMLRKEAAAPQLRSAAIGVLALNPLVTVAQAQDPANRKSLEVAFVDKAARPGSRQLIYIDPTTGVLLAEMTTGIWPSGVPDSYIATIGVREVVDGLPADVAQSLGTAKVVKDGNTVGTPYEGPHDPLPVASQAGKDPRPWKSPVPVVTPRA